MRRNLLDNHNARKMVVDGVTSAVRSSRSVPSLQDYMNSQRAAIKASLPREVKLDPYLEALVEAGRHAPS